MRLAAPDGFFENAAIAVAPGTGQEERMVRKPMLVKTME
jgi:hypothetical protein